jgi:hypothetical protein
MYRLDGLSVLLLSTSMVFLGGCTGQQRPTPQAKPACVVDANVAEAMSAARAVLGRMGFAIDKADPNAGLIRTEPLPAGQFFEFWRSDNVSFGEAVEANLHAIRRSVELHFRPSQGQVRINCTVSVQRLSLPGQAVSSVSQAYLIHSRSTPALQTFNLTPQQKATMAWIDLEDDGPLAQRILERIRRRITRQQEKEAA